MSSQRTRRDTQSRPWPLAVNEAAERNLEGR
jgi:hypothetical protein